MVSNSSQIIFESAIFRDISLCKTSFDVFNISLACTCSHNVIGSVRCLWREKRWRNRRSTKVHLWSCLLRMWPPLSRRFASNTTKRLSFGLLISIYCTHLSPHVFSVNMYFFRVFLSWWFRWMWFNSIFLSSLPSKSPCRVWITSNCDAVTPCMRSPKQRWTLRLSVLFAHHF